MGWCYVVIRTHSTLGVPCSGCCREGDQADCLRTMEDLLQKLPETEAKDVVIEERHAYLHFSATNTGMEGSAGFSSNVLRTGVSAEIHFGHVDTEKNTNLLPAPPTLEPNTSSSSVTPTQSEPVGIALEDKVEKKEIYLRAIYELPQNHGFYCPNCKACIDKVFVYKIREPESPQVELPESPDVRSSVDGSSETEEPPATGDGIRCSACFEYLIRIGRKWIPWLGPDEQGRIIDMPQPEAEPILVPGPAERGKRWEILKSIVYGGLTEILASLSVVTSAASADATTLNIVALAIANLIGGLFVLVHNLRELKGEQPRAREEDNETDAPVAVDRYSELLGHKDNFVLHAFLAILSFLIFGLVPPAVYGFAFRESDDKDLKLAAVAVASVLCITLLAIAKSYTQRPNNVGTYLKTVLLYLTTGALASLLTYVAGTLMKRLVEYLGWFEPRPNFGLPLLPEMSVDELRWGSY